MPAAGCSTVAFILPALMEAIALGAAVEPDDDDARQVGGLERSSRAEGHRVVAGNDAHVSYRSPKEKCFVNHMTNYQAAKPTASLPAANAAAQRRPRQEPYHHGSSLMRWCVLLSAVPLLAQRVAPTPPIRWGAEVLRQQPSWYASAEARTVADNVLLYQSVHGAWPKNTDLVKPGTPDALAGIQKGGEANTIDNNATTLPMEFLALMVQATGETRYRAAFERGMDYLLAAQYPNGGWPQFFPLRDGYYSRITYNDNAMVNVLTVLRDAAAGKTPYTFVDEARRGRARTAVARGIDIILRTQVKQGGTLTAWCAQHDEKTLAPAWARAYEPPSLSGSESVGIVRFLMDIEHPAPAVTAAIDGAVAWLRSVAIHGVRLEEFTGADGRKDRRVVADPAAAPLWARFYELGTNRPIFLGRDSVVRYALSEIEYERRNGYAYYGTWPASLLARRDARQR
jgi:PelA/Pel-15E family pectate lyase